MYPGRTSCRCTSTIPMAHRANAWVPDFLSVLWHEHRWLLVAVLLAVVTRAAVFVALELNDPAPLSESVLVNDAISYHEPALKIARELSIDGFPQHRTPGYPAFLGAIYFLSGDRVTAALAVQLAVEAGTVLLVYLLALEMFGDRRVAVVSSILYAVSFFSAFYATRLLSETLFTALLAVSVLMTVRGVRRYNSGWIAAAGVLAGLCALVRPIAQFYPLVVVVVLLLMANRAFAWRGLAAVAFVAAFVLTTLPWQARNLATYGYYELSSLQGSNLFYFNAAKSKSDNEGITLAEARAALLADIEPSRLDHTSNEFERSAVLRGEALSYMAGHPVAYATAHFKGVARMLFYPDVSAAFEVAGAEAGSVYPAEGSSPLDRLTKTVQNLRSEHVVVGAFGLKWLAEYALLAVALIVMFRNRNPYLLTALLTLAYFALATGVVGDTRFRVPLVPLIAAVAGMGAYEVWGWLGSRFVSGR